MIYKSRSKTGFTLIELLVVVALIGILSAIVLVSLRTVRSKARDAERISDLKQLQSVMDLFYDTYGKYPMSAGAPTWAGHWQNLATCLEQGTGCGFAISSYSPVIGKVPWDPLYKGNINDSSARTYYYAYPSGCNTGQAYRLAAKLENSNVVFSSDLDGGYYADNNGCNDTSPYYGYCVGEGTCAGW